MFPAVHQLQTECETNETHDADECLFLNIPCSSSLYVISRLWIDGSIVVKIEGNTPPANC